MNDRRPRSRQPDGDGLYDKDHVCHAWLKNHEITVDQAHALVPDKAEVTVRNWLRRFAYEWETGEPPEGLSWQNVCPQSHTGDLAQPPQRKTKKLKLKTIN